MELVLKMIPTGSGIGLVALSRKHQSESSIIQDIFAEILIIYLFELLLESGSLCTRKGASR